MSKPKRNKALAVLDGRLELERAEYTRRLAAAEESLAVLKATMTTREQVAKAYERPKAGPRVGKRAVKPTTSSVAQQDLEHNAKRGGSVKADYIEAARRILTPEAATRYEASDMGATDEAGHAAIEAEVITIVRERIDSEGV